MQSRSVAVFGIVMALGAGALLSTATASAKPKPKPPTRVSLGEYEEYYNASEVQEQFVDMQYDIVKGDIDSCNSDKDDANSQQVDQQNAENRKTLYFARQQGDQKLVRWAQRLDARAEAYTSDHQADVRKAGTQLSRGFAKLVDALSYYFSAEQGLASLNCNQTQRLNDGLRNFLESRPTIRKGFEALNAAVEKEP